MTEGWLIERDESGASVRLHLSPRPAESLAGESQACRRPLCKKAVPPQKVRRGSPKVYCSDRCCRLHWEEQHPRVGVQRALDFTPAGRERAEKLRRRESRADALLAALRERPLRRSEAKAIGGDRFSARFNELRADGHWIVGPEKAPRWGINERTEPYPDGEDMYILVEPRP